MIADFQEKTPLQTLQASYGALLSRRNPVSWILSALTAAGLNLAFFLLMPHLMDPASPRPAFEALAPQVNVIRIKRPETEVARKTKPPAQPETRQTVRPRALSTQPLSAKLTLPFEINPRLPSGPTTLNLPLLESTAMNAGAGLQNAFSEGQLDAPLTVLTRIPPVYPMNARRRGIEGWVKVKFLVGETGDVGNIAILEARPPDIFEQSVERCVSGWRFKPGTVEGEPVKTWVETTIRFELE